MGVLYVVATPIGNLQELTSRAADALREADLIAAEDTRVTLKLLNHLGITKPLISCHRHNEAARTNELIARMIEEDITVALTSDAGTPAISDPGHLLVAAAWEAGITVIPIGGSSAVSVALSASGFDAREYAFYGFPPREGKALREKLAAIHRSGIPVAVLYESPHRVVKLVEAVAAQFPECRMAVCCDLTKRFELILRGDPAGVLARMRENPNVEKGEYCVVLDRSGVPASAPEAAPIPPEAQIFLAMLAGDSMREAVECAIENGCPRNQTYKAKLEIQRFLADAKSGEGD